MRTAPELSRSAAWALIGLGAVAALWNAGVDLDAQTSLAKTQHGAIGVGGASVIYQLMVLAFAGVAGYLLFRARSWVLGGMAMTVLVFFLAYNMLSVMSFQARERIIPAKIAEEQQRAGIDAELEAQMTQKQRQDEAIANLRRDAVEATAAIKFARTKEQKLAAQERKRAADSAYLNASFATVTARALPAREVSSDYQAEFVAMLLGYFGYAIPVDQVQTILSAWWGAGLNFAKVICWFFGFGLMPAKRRRIAAEPVNDAAPARPEPVAPPSNVRAFPVTKPTPAEPKSLTSLEQVKQFLSEATRPSPGARIAAAAMHQHFLKWAEMRGHPRLNGNLFGRHCTSLGVTRDNSRNAVCMYVGLGLCPLQEEGPLIMAA